VAESQLSEFLQALQGDPAIRAKLEQASDHEALAIAEIAKEAGFAVPIEDLKVRGHWWQYLPQQNQPPTAVPGQPSADGLHAFLEQVAHNKGLQAKLQAAPGSPEACAAIANDAGFSISAEELKKEVFRRWRCGDIK
jgi:predicted ribosomally synthesized peptide with nif11-like leader